MVLQHKVMNLEVFLDEYQTNISLTLSFEHVRKNKKEVEIVHVQNAVVEERPPEIVLTPFKKK